MNGPNTYEISLISANDKKTTNSLLKKLDLLKQKRISTLVLITYAELKKVADKRERIFMEKILNIDPRKFGILSPALINAAPKGDMAAIAGQKYTWKEKEIEIPAQYLPKNVYKAYLETGRNLKKDTGKSVLIKSGYRSDAYQLLTFLYWLSKNEFDLALTLRGVALPGYSEHGYPPKQGMDFVTEDGISEGDEICFDETKEYKWLVKNGERFGFYLSYPKNNPYGMIFEPWHWHYE